MATKMSLCSCFPWKKKTIVENDNDDDDEEEEEVNKERKFPENTVPEESTSSN